MSYKIASLLLALSIAFSTWLYWGSDYRVRHIITANEWESHLETLMPDTLASSSVPGTHPLQKVSMTANVKYLPNGSYIRVSTIKLFTAQQEVMSIDMSEHGDWKMTDDYLLITPKDFKDLSSPKSQEVSTKQLNLVKQLFKMDAQQSRKVDVINPKTLLLTSLDHGSQVLFAN